MEYNSLWKYQKRFEAEHAKYDNRLEKVNKILLEFVDRVIDNELKNADYITHSIYFYDGKFLLVC